MRTKESDQKKVQDAIALRNRALGRQQTFRTQWQSIADLMFPQSYGIATKHAIGDELMSQLFDTTAVEELENMAWNCQQPVSSWPEVLLFGKSYWHGGFSSSDRLQLLSY